MPGAFGYFRPTKLLQSEWEPIQYQTFVSPSTK